MEDRELEDLMAVLPPLLQALDRLAFVARHLHPPHLPELLAAAGEPEAALAEALPRLADWPPGLADVRDALEGAGAAALRGWEGLRAAPVEGLRPAYRALGQLPRALEALYPLAQGLPPVSRFFLDPAARGDARRLAQLAQAPPRADVGVFHVENAPDQRGGFSLYVPEDHTPDRVWPLVMALHGGAGHGRSFLWSWLAAARTHGAIVIAPTAVGDTWALMGDDADTPNLAHILEQARARWTLDPARLLLTGMSDGGTFSYVSGLEAGSPFTHLGPVSAAFHPMLAQMADPDRIRGLPIHVAHGALDWMFAVDQAREAARVLGAAGARVVYREIDDLSHTWPREIGAALLAWLDGNGG